VGKNILITGANRGIGYALSKNYVEKGDKVFAVCRKSTQALRDLKGVTIIDEIDVTDEEKLKNLIHILENTRLDIVINNAGIMTKEVFGEIKSMDVLQQFIVNAMAPLRVTEALRRNLSVGSKVIFITSRMGSISDNTSGGYYGYRMSKAALNSAGVSLAQDLKPDNISVVMIHPGFVQTDLVNNQGDINASKSAENIIKRIGQLDIEHSGEFWHANGEMLNW
jgi:NAD(P)-dependent dehydrogenase (short-subunit alcohol dehydrogenase family)